MSPAELAEEQKLIRRLQFMMNLVLQTIAQDGSLTIDEASQMIADARKAALAMFPGKELAYDLIWRPASSASCANASASCSRQPSLRRQHDLIHRNIQHSHLAGLDIANDHVQQALPLLRNLQRQARRDLPLGDSRIAGTVESR